MTGAALALGAVLLAAARPEAAATTSGAPASASASALPRGWRELPELAAASDDGATRRGFGDPGAGCVALRQELAADGATTAAALHDALGRELGELGLGEAPASAEARDRELGAAGLLAPPWSPLASRLGDDSVIAVRGRGLEGLVRTRVQASAGRTTVTSLACLWTARDPIACRRDCTALLADPSGPR